MWTWRFGNPRIEGIQVASVAPLRLVEERASRGRYEYQWLFLLHCHIILLSHIQLGWIFTMRKGPFKEMNQ